MISDRDILNAIKTVVDVISKKWAVDILYYLQIGEKRYSELANDIDEISNKMLTERLKELCEMEVVDKIVLSLIPLTIKYELSTKGRKICKLLSEMTLLGLDLDNIEVNTEIEDELRKYFTQS